MQTVPEIPTQSKPDKAFYATVYDAPAQLVHVGGVIYVVTEEEVTPFEVAMAPFTCVLGEVGAVTRSTCRRHRTPWVCLDRHAPADGEAVRWPPTPSPPMAHTATRPTKRLIASMPSGRAPRQRRQPVRRALFSLTLRGRLNGIETLLTVGA